MHCVGTQSPSHHPVHPVPNVLGREPPGLGDPVHSHSHPVTPAQYFRDWVGHEVECAYRPSSLGTGLHSAKWSAHTGTVHPVLGTDPVSRPSSFVMTQCIHPVTNALGRDDWVTGRSVLGWVVMCTSLCSGDRNFQGFASLYRTVILCEDTKRVKRLNQTTNGFIL